MSLQDHFSNDLDSWESDDDSEYSDDSTHTSTPTSPIFNSNRNSQIQHTLSFSNLHELDSFPLPPYSLGSRNTDSSHTSNSTISAHDSVRSRPVAPPPPTTTTPASQPTMYHNPRFIGTLNFYYPRRVRLANATSQPAVSNDSNIPINSNPPIPPPAPPQPTRRFHQTKFDSIWDAFQSSDAEVATNEEWGDSIGVKLDNTARLYFQNVNSLGLSTGRKKWQHILRSLNTAECDIIGLAQTSINWKKMHIRDRFLEPLRKKMPISKGNLSRNSFPTENSVLPGGVAQIVQGNWTGRIVDHVHDFRKMGRWSGFKLRLKHDRYLVVISAYRVCPNTATGVETAHRQQDFMLSMEGMINPDPRRQFILDMIQCIQDLQSPMLDVILSLDANEALGESAHGLTQLMRECKLVDLFHHHHGNCPQFATYDGGSRRLDYMIGSSRLLPYITRCGYLEFYKGFLRIIEVCFWIYPMR